MATTIGDGMVRVEVHLQVVPKPLDFGETLWDIVFFFGSKNFLLPTARKFSSWYQISSQIALISYCFPYVEALRARFPPNPKISSQIWRHGGKQKILTL